MAGEASKADIRRFLIERTFCGGLSDAVLARLLSVGRRRAFARGEALFGRGDPGDSMMIVLDGAVKISATTSAGREVVLNFLRAGDIIGEISVLDGGARSADAAMIEPGALFVVAGADMRAALEKEPQALMAVAEALCAKLRAASETAEAYQMDVRGRCAAGLLRLAALHGRETERGVEMDLFASQQELGAFVGASRENTSRQLSHFARIGCILIDRRRLVIVDREALEAFADG